LEELKVTLVVFVDDLDRCLPKTAISTLESIRLLLFLKRSAFVIAADNEFIRGAVSVHFEEQKYPAKLPQTILTNSSKFLCTFRDSELMKPKPTSRSSSWNERMQTATSMKQLSRTRARRFQPAYSQAGEETQ
jgi:hypothetical protein